MNTPRSCFMMLIRATLEGIMDWVWDQKTEMKGWELEGQLDLLVENEDDCIVDF